jgi:hypothetical protein
MPVFEFLALRINHHRDRLVALQQSQAHLKFNKQFNTVSTAIYGLFLNLYKLNISPYTKPFKTPAVPNLEL